MGEIAKELGKKWAETSPEMKKKYSEQGEVEKEKYNKVRALYVQYMIVFHSAY